jgi:hypothetical protein
MANNFVFVSPGVKFREQDLSFVTKTVGVTTLGLVGETPKGPAFQPVAVEDKGQFTSRFGSQSIEKFPTGDLKFQLPYVGNAYLDNSNQLYVTRVLGLSGYNAGTAWGIKINSAVNYASTGLTTSGSSVVGFTNSTYLGVTITNTGQTAVIFTGYTKTSPTLFTTVKRSIYVLTLSAGNGTVHVLTTTYTGTSIAAYDNMVVAILRPRATVTDNTDAAPTTVFDASTVTIISNSTTVGTGDVFGKFTLRAVGSSTEDYIVSLNEDSRDFIVNVLGDRPKGKNTKLYVESVFPDLIKKLDADGLTYSVSTTVINATTSTFTNYQQSFKTPETPWVVSELRGSSIDRLFKFISISDGNSANEEIKISIANIDPITKEFDIIVRDFFDTDSAINIKESFVRCSMQKGLNNYVGSRVGTIDGEYDLQSKYIMLELDANAPEDSFPAGFEGYVYYNFAISATSASSVGQTPKVYYKQSYTTTDKISRTYLGISERAYDATNLVGTGINQNAYNFAGVDISGINGNATSGHVKSKGFHMDSGATGTYYDGSTLVGQFLTGAGHFQTASDVNNVSNPYNLKSSRKFTLVPYGGFDGWDEHRVSRSNGDLYGKGKVFDGVAAGFTPTNDFQAWEAAIDTFSNPEQVTINLFATPGINFSDNLSLINEGIDLVETKRADSLYLLDAPDLPDTSSLAQDIVDLLDTTDIDTSYAAVYYPWIQLKDTTNNVNVFLPPTVEVAKSIAFNDNIAFPWFAPAGLQRGVTDAKKARRKLSLGERDILYDGRINPMATFPETGVAIFGQKTLQKKQSSLDRVNVRRLLLQLKVLISNVAIRLVFEQDDQTTIDNFLNKVNPILETIRRERGLEQFRVKMDDTNNTPETRDRNELYGEIAIVPTKSVEFIGLQFTISPSGASFAA